MSLFAPAHSREDIWALFAFNYEIAKTREVVSESRLGLIRLQWWRERIGDIFDRGEVPDNEILKALAVAIKNHNLPREHFETLIYAREFDLEDVLPANMDGFLNYADFTSVPLMKMAVQVAGGDPDYEPVQAAAVNYALMGILRAVPTHARQRRCYLPDDLMKKHGVTLNKLYDFLKPEEGIKNVAKDVAGFFVTDVRPENKFLRAAQAISGLYHRQIAAAEYDVFSNRMIHPPAFKEARVFVKAIF